MRSRFSGVCCLLSALTVCAFVAECSDSVQVTCGSLVKLQHTHTGHLLHSHDISYGSGSGQQSVTGFSGGDDAGSYWIVRGTEHERCAQGTPVKLGQQVRLQHSATRRWLHSHHFPAPLTNNQEVSAFGDDTTSDTGDIWTIHGYVKTNKFWTRDADVEFRHEDTGMLLASSSRKYGRPIAGQQEVCAKKQGRDTWWRATEGVYYPVRANR